MIFTNKIEVKLIQHVGSDAMVIGAAKVSVDPEEALEFTKIQNTEGSAGLINYLIKQGHCSPFEHGLMTFYVHAPIFVFREFMRHRIGWGYNEESARYKELSPTFWIPKRDRKMIPIEGYKSARPQFDLADQKRYNMAISAMQAAYIETYKEYQIMIQAGIGREVARTVLPVGTYSSVWATCNPRSLMHFLSLRTHDEKALRISYPQAEIEEVARAMEENLAKFYPLTYKAFCSNGRQC